MINFFQKFLLSEFSKKKIEKFILSLAIIGFFIHLFFIYAEKNHLFHLSTNKDLLVNPISAIYTPFSFILFYEVYLLIYYLQKSFSKYIGKQYEIITLILIRKIFKDLSNLNLNDNFFSNKNDLQLLYDLVTVLFLFFLIFYFYYLYAKPTQNFNEPQKQQTKNINKFIKLKVTLSCILIPILIVLTLYSFTNWVITVFYPINDTRISPLNLNNIFFEEFFTILILTDVLLLLLSFINTDNFSIVMRNSAFVISTILIKLSFTTTGLISNVIIIIALLFGVIMLYLHNQYNKMNTPTIL